MYSIRISKTIHFIRVPIVQKGRSDHFFSLSFPSSIHLSIYISLGRHYLDTSVRTENTTVDEHIKEIKRSEMSIRFYRK